MALKKSQQSLKNWTKQKWRTKSGKKSSETGERYLPEAAIKNMSEEEYAATTRAKREGTRKGKQFVAQPKKIAKKTKKYRTMKNYKKGGKVVTGYNILNMKPGPERDNAMAHYLSFSTTLGDSVGGIYQKGGMMKAKKSQMGMMKSAAPKRKKEMSDKEYFKMQDRKRKKGQESMSGQDSVNFLMKLMGSSSDKNDFKKRAKSAMKKTGKSMANEGLNEAEMDAFEVMARTSPTLLRKMEMGGVLKGALTGALTGAATGALSGIGSGKKKEEEVAQMKDFQTGKSGMRFKKLSRKIQKSGKSKSAADAIAASIGRKKYGAKKFAAMAAAGRKKGK
tara:strand:- start:714 stop:1718 length:1005 start_codon:yes stop_codon:yes gene_type:complete